MGRRSWRKLWQDALRSSPKWSRLRAAEKGCYLECFLLANDDGELLLRPGVPLTVEDLAFEMNTRPHTAAKWVETLLSVGLLASQTGLISVASWGERQKVDMKWDTSETSARPTPKDLQPHKPSHKEEKRGRREEEEKRIQDDPAHAGIVQLLQSHEKWKTGIKDHDGFTRTLIATYGEEWGGAGILSQLKKMAAWLLANPRKRYKEHRRFIINWFNRAEVPPTPERDNGRPREVADTPPGHPAFGREPGEWQEGGFTHRLTREFLYAKRSEGGSFPNDWEKVKRRKA